MGLIRPETTDNKMHITDVVPFDQVFSKKHRQKKPRLNSYDYESMLESAETIQEKVYSLILFYPKHPIVLLISRIHP